MTGSAFTTILLFTATIFILFSAIMIAYRIQNKPLKQFEKAHSEALNKWLQTQVCLYCDVSMNELDKRAKNRISGAAYKAIVALRQNKDIEIQLPNIVKDASGQPRHFIKKVSIHDVRHLTPPEDNV